MPDTGFPVFRNFCPDLYSGSARGSEPHPARWTVDVRSCVAVNAALRADTAIRVIGIHTRGHETGIRRTDLQNALFHYEVIRPEKSQTSLTNEIFDVKCCTRNLKLISLLLDRPSEITDFHNYQIDYLVIHGNCGVKKSLINKLTSCPLCVIKHRVMMTYGEAVG
jgi:hypothetical protein